METKDIQSILHNSAAEEIPAERINLWPAVRENLATRKPTLFTQGDSMNRQKPQPRRIRLAALITLAVICASLVFGASPYGRAFAQTILQFFTRTSGESEPVPTLAATLAPILSSPEASPTPQPISRLPFQETCGNTLQPHCDLVTIRNMVNFPVWALVEPPAGTAFMGATGGSQQVILVYYGDGLNGSLTLNEEPISSPEQQLWKVAASAQVETVSIGAATGEFVTGAWWLNPGDESGELQWDSSMPKHTLRWEADGLRFTMIFQPAKSDKGILLDKDSMLALASHLTSENSSEPTPSPTPMVSLEELNRQTGFEVKQPTWLPDGYVFQEAVYSAQWNGACLFYSYRQATDGWPLLTIFENSAQAAPRPEDIKCEATWEGKAIDIPMDLTPVEIGGAEGGQGTHMGNGVEISKLCTYPGQIANQALLWQAQGKGYVIFGLIDQFQGHGFITQMEMRRIAESLTGGYTIPAEKLDPGRLLSVEDAESLAGFDVKEPARMLADMHFDHAAYRQSAGLNEVYLVYIGGSNGLGSNYGFTFIQAQGVTQTMDETFLAGGYEHLTLNGLPAIYREFCWDNSGGGSGECRQEMTWFEGQTRFDIQALLPGAMPKEDYLEIARGMR